MKQYWSFFKSGKFAFLALFFVSLTVISCDNDDDNNVSPDPPIEKGEIELAENAQALNYFDFINPNDVEILTWIIHSLHKKENALLVYLQEKH